MHLFNDRHSGPGEHTQTKLFPICLPTKRPWSVTRTRSILHPKGRAFFHGRLNMKAEGFLHALMANSVMKQRICTKGDMREQLRECTYSASSTTNQTFVWENIQREVYSAVEYTDVLVQDMMTRPLETKMGPKKNSTFVIGCARWMDLE